jgi:hypothetical protein
MSNLTAICIEYRRSNLELNKLCNELLGDAPCIFNIFYFLVSACAGVIIYKLNSLPKVQEPKLQEIKRNLGAIEEK